MSPRPHDALARSKAHRPHKAHGVETSARVCAEGRTVGAFELLTGPSEAMGDKRVPNRVPNSTNRSDRSASLLRERDAMVAVLDEVRPSDLEDVDGEHDAVGKCRAQNCKPAAREASLGPEVAAEICAAIERTDDAVDRNLLKAEIRTPGKRQPATDLVERD
jgi:hypothetical protein